MDSRQEPPAPAVDLVTGKCKPGKVSRTVSTSPLTLDLTVMCAPGAEVLQPGAAAQGVLPPDTVDNTVAAFDMNTSAIVMPAPVVGQPGLKAKEFPTLRLPESPDLLPSLGLSSSSFSPMLPWGTSEDSSPPFSPNRVREGHSQDVQDEGSLFNVSPLSPGLVVRPTRGSGAAPSEGVLLPTMLEDFDDSVLGDPISNADSPIAAGEDRLLETGLPGCPYRFSEFGELLFTDGNPAYGLQLHHPRFLELVGAPESARLLDCSPSFWVEQLGKEQAMAAPVNLQRDAGVMLSNLQILSQFAMTMNRMSFSTMALGLGQSLFPKVEVNDLAPAPQAARAASYMSAMGLWHPQTTPGVPRPVPVSSCHSYMSCKYCFPEDQLPPG